MLTLVRHGQAAYMQADYDRLSGLGEEQAARLGDYWVRHRIVFDRVIHGPARRHIRTMEIAGERVRAAGLPWPDPEQETDFDEFDAFTMMRLLTPIFVAQDPEIRNLNSAFNENKHTPEAGRYLQKLFEAAARRWSTGRFDLPEVESWQHFRDRVSLAIRKIRDTAVPSSSTVVFTSGGPIAASLGLALELSGEKTVEFVWLCRNSSYTQLLFSGDRFSLHAYNAIPHLDDLRLFTYR